MYCNNCGEKIREGASFCQACGNKIVIRGKSADVGTAHESSNTTSKAFSIDTENVKAKAEETMTGLSNAAKEAKDITVQTAGAAMEKAAQATKDIRDKTGEMLDGFNASEKANLAKKKTKNIFEWYTSNWSRVFKTSWSGEGLKHHLLWVEAHALVVLILLVFLFVKGDKSVAVNNNETSLAENKAVEANAHELDAKSYVESLYSEPSEQEEKNVVDQAADAVKEKANEIGNEIDYATKVLFSSLYGTWTNDSGTFTLTIGKDGTVKIADSTGTFGADAFTYTEVDDDTVRLKVSSDNFFAQIISIDMDYYVNGETLTISALDMTFDLKRKK